MERARSPATLAEVTKSLQPVLQVSAAVRKPTSGSEGSVTKLAVAVEGDPLKDQPSDGGGAVVGHGGGAMPDIGPPAPQSDPVPPPVVQPVPVEFSNELGKSLGEFFLKENDLILQTDATGRNIGQV